MIKTEKRRIGDIGEEIASRFLMKQGHRVRERNYLKKWGEIDIVSENNGALHFVEVKTVQSSLISENIVPRGTISHETLKNVTREPQKWNNTYRPEENVHPQKIKRLHRAIQSYLVEHNVSYETPWQLDVITILLDLKTKKAKVNILENVIL